MLFSEILILRLLLLKLAIRFVQSKCKQHPVSHLQKKKQLKSASLKQNEVMLIVKPIDIAYQFHIYLHMYWCCCCFIYMQMQVASYDQNLSA